MPRRRTIRLPSIISANSGFFCSAALKLRSSSESTRQSLFATAVAARGESLIAAISPNTSPTLTAPISLPFAESATWPSMRKYILSRFNIMRLAFSFSAKNTVPAATVSSLPADSKNERAIAAMQSGAWGWGAGAAGFGAPAGLLKSRSSDISPHCSARIRGNDSARSPRARPARRPRRAGRCLLRHPHPAGAGKFCNYRHADLDLPRSGGGARLREAGRGDRQQRARPARRGARGGDPPRLRGDPRGEAARRIRRRRDPGRRRHPDQHERQRGGVQPRARADGKEKGRLRVAASARPRQPVAEHQRRLSDGDQAGAALRNKKIIE